MAEMQLSIVYMFFHSSSPPAPPAAEAAAAAAAAAADAAPDWLDVLLLRLDDRSRSAGPTEPRESRSSRDEDYRGLLNIVVKTF